MKRLYSIWLSVVIQFQRLVDHAWRYTTGLPLAKRSVITPQLILGGQYGVRSMNTLRKLGVTAVVNMRMHSVHKDIAVKGLSILNLPTPDRHAPSLADLQKGVRFIESEIKRDGKVYIHCKYGEGRGPTMAITYLIYSGMTYDDAYTLVKNVRTFISPTKVQIDRMKEFERKKNKQDA
jgi:protein-tyrosine phosphatase